MMICLPPQGTPPPHSSRYGLQHTQHTASTAATPHYPRDRKPSVKCEAYFGWLFLASTARELARNHERIAGGGVELRRDRAPAVQRDARTDRRVYRRRRSQPHCRQVSGCISDPISAPVDAAAACGACSKRGRGAARGGHAPAPAHGRACGRAKALQRETASASQPFAHAGPLASRCTWWTSLARGSGPCSTCLSTAASPRWRSGVPRAQATR